METGIDMLAQDPSAVAMTPLELNAIQLDETHTVLTPEYLEKIKAQASSQAPEDHNPSPAAAPGVVN